LAAIPLLTGIAWSLRGERGALSALVGGLVAFAVFGAGLFAITKVVEGPPGLSIAGALVVYFGQLVILLFVIVWLRDARWLDGRAFVAAVLAEGLIWQIGQVTGFLRARHPIYDQAGVETYQSNDG
jgi:hypothetical protein